MNEDKTEKLKDQLDHVLNSDSDKSEINYKARRAIVEVIPNLGPLFSYFYQKHVVSPSSKRLNDFYQALVDALCEISAKVACLDFDSPSFTTTFMYAIQIASRNHQEEKLSALRNAVINSVIIPPLDDDIQKIFLNLIDDFTPSHIRVLSAIYKYGLKKNKYGAVDNEWKEVDNEYIEEKFPDISNKYEFYEQILKDLVNRNLIQNNDSKSDFSSSRSSGDTNLNPKRATDEIKRHIERRDLRNAMNTLGGVFNQYELRHKKDQEKITELTRHFNEKEESLISSLFTSVNSKTSVMYFINFGTTNLGDQFVKFIEKPNQDL
jgi:hypothetical protein